MHVYDVYSLTRSNQNVLATGHHIHAWKMLYAACTETTSWW